MISSFAAIGDSFAEGVGDELPDGSVRGWADFVAMGLATAAGGPVGYANLAIRGRKLGPIVEEQLEPALALRPDVLAINGGGNDILRLKVSIEGVSRLLERAVDRALETGTRVVVASGANPTRNLPVGRFVRGRGDALAQAVRSWIPTKPGVVLVDNWSDDSLLDLAYWAPDKLHLNALGHSRVAANLLRALDVPVPAAWGVAEVQDAVAAGRPGTIAYYREFVLPWLGRRLTGRSSGDGRDPKRPTLEPMAPPQRETAGR